MAENKWRCRAEDLKGTQTEKNLQEAFAGESQARNKYTFFASKAKKEGYVQISNIFAETAANLRFILMDAVAIDEIFAPDEVDKIYLNFSDPWPKDRHAKEGFLQGSFWRVFTIY